MRAKFRRRGRRVPRKRFLFPLGFVFAMIGAVLMLQSCPLIGPDMCTKYHALIIRLLEVIILI